MGMRGILRGVLESGVTVIALVLLGAAVVAWGALHPLPSDATMAARFRAQRAAFDSLRTLLAGESHVTDVVSDWTGAYVANRTMNVMRRRPDLELGVTETRWREHRRLMRALGVRVVSRGESGRVSLWAGERGLVTGDVRKGYVWSAAPLSPVWTSLDDAVEARALVAYKPLGDHWWLAVVREDDER